MVKNINARKTVAIAERRFTTSLFIQLNPLILLALLSQWIFLSVDFPQRLHLYWACKVIPIALSIKEPIAPKIVMIKIISQFKSMKYFEIIEIVKAPIIPPIVPIIEIAPLVPLSAFQK